jgi:hypothetical protein
MMRVAIVLMVLLPFGICSAQAQSRVYVGMTMAADAGNRGNIPGGAVPSLGGMVGVRVSDAWSIEVEVERGFRTTTAGSGEAVLVAYPPTLTPTYEEIQLYGIRTRDERTQTAGAGWSAHAAWRSREAGRVNVGLLAGVSSRVYDAHLMRTTTFVSPLINLPANYRLPDEVSSRRMIGGGISGGLVVLVRATRQLTIAPEFRTTVGLITDDPYRVFRVGVRSVWEF